MFDLAGHFGNVEKDLYLCFAWSKVRRNNTLGISRSLQGF